MKSLSGNLVVKDSSSPFRVNKKEVKKGLCGLRKSQAV